MRIKSVLYFDTVPKTLFNFCKEVNEKIFSGPLLIFDFEFDFDFEFEFPFDTAKMENTIAARYYTF